MFRLTIFDRLPIRLTAAFLLAASLGVALVGVLAYRFTSSEFSAFLGHMTAMERMMGGQTFALAFPSELDDEANIEFGVVVLRVALLVTVTRRDSRGATFHRSAAYVHAALGQEVLARPHVNVFSE